jgi:hypothetical protein
MDYLTRDAVADWLRHQPEDALFCEHCLTRLVQTDEGDWYCPNQMCLYDEQGKIESDDEAPQLPEAQLQYKGGELCQQ